MPKDTVHIGLLSDTHSYWDDRMTYHLKDCDEIWHAGDLGSLFVFDTMQKLGAKLRVVFGNIDDHHVRSETEEILQWELQGIRFCMTHIGGRPGRYAKGIRNLLNSIRPDVFVCGHSHMLKVQHDDSFGGLYINPGAAGTQGFHQKRTLIKFSLIRGSLSQMHVIELGDRRKKP